MKIDILVIGGGVFGLNIAYQLASSGQKIALIDAHKIGTGASGGILGSLMPYMPHQWNAKKQFQFEALTQLPHFCAKLETETGITTGYKKAGRLMPIAKPGFLRQIEMRMPEAVINWGHEHPFEVRQDIEPYARWICLEKAPLGLVYEGLSASIQPRKYLQALHKAVNDKGVFIYEDTHCNIEDIKRGFIQLKGRDGKRLYFEQTVITAGYHSFQLLEGLELPNLGTGIAGEAVMMRLDKPLFDADMPILYDDNLYVIAHDKQHVAIGSTSYEWNDFANHPAPQKEVAQNLYRRALAFCPALKNAEMVEQWAGIRPKTHGREPIIGRIPNFPHLYIATGGFKIGIGIAHKIAEHIAQDILSANIASVLPQKFSLSHHLALASS